MPGRLLCLAISGRGARGQGLRNGRFSCLSEEARYDGKWVLRTNMDLEAPDVALQSKRLWMVEAYIRSCKSLLHTRPIYHQEPNPSATPLLMPGKDKKFGTRDDKTCPWPQQRTTPLRTP